MKRKDGRKGKQEQVSLWKKTGVKPSPRAIRKEKGSRKKCSPGDGDEDSK
ncbi:Hypothetical protein Minf_0505 [Methylacidiphilum infernorum V4]|uniref:Uncharacterized protein n=1 Tax=Methylacidiphilum infernorum (isolate V4) TaxID=481448 RepID=B3DZE6_METI4|nr:Hypothetical protein Minf_0505 [Methylacidiphilum infernorum V4]